MKTSVDINKLLNDKVLFLIPNFLYFSLFCYFYNEAYNGFGISLDVLFRDIIFISFVYFVIFTIIHFLLKRKLSSLSIFFIKVILILLSFNFINASKIVFVVLFLIYLLVIVQKEMFQKMVALLFSYIICFMVIMYVPTAIFNVVSLTMQMKSSDISKEFLLEKKNDIPNVYWIHCDGMISLDTASKYFDFDNKEIIKYLEDGEFYYNNTIFNNGGNTALSLVALYNPEYYDNFFKEYLDSYSLAFVDSKANLPYLVSYDDLVSRRQNNELFNALALKKYKFSAITQFNAYSSFYADYMLSYYDYLDEIDKLHYAKKKDNSDFVLNIQSDITRMNSLFDLTVFGSLFKNMDFRKYELLDVNDFDYSKNSIINDTDYWYARAILKGLNVVDIENENKLFTFIDLTLNHAPWLYDENGKKVNNDLTGESVTNYIDNYKHSTDLIMEIVDYIKSMDSDAIIVLQGDHGIHTVDANYLKNHFDCPDYKCSVELRNSTFNAIYIPKKYINGDEKYLDNPLNISRYLVNNIVGHNYEYIE